MYIYILMTGSKLKTEEYKASPKTNNGTRETHPCQISIDEKTNSKTTQLRSKQMEHQDLIY